MMQDYCEIICQAVDTIVEKRIEGLNFDKTIVCTVVDDSKAGSGIYTVDMGSRTFEASSSLTDLKKNNSVYVTIPGNDFNQPKIIVGKATSEELNNLEYVRPLEKMIIATEQLFDIKDYKGSEPVGIIANEGNSRIPKYNHDPQEDWSSDDADDYLSNINGKRILYRKFEDGNIMNGYTRLGISAEFKTLLHGAVTGSYGLLFCLGSSVVIKDVKYTKIAYRTFSCEEMFGDYYNYNLYYPQEWLFDISDTFNQLDYIAVYLVQDNNFYKYNNEGDLAKFGPSNYLDIMVRQCTAYLGYDKEDLDGNNLTQLYTVQDLKYSESDSEAARARTIGLRWIHKMGEEYIYVDSLDKLEDKNIEICWYVYKAGAGSSDQYAGVEWERQVQYKKKTEEIDDAGNIQEIFNDRFSSLKWDWETKLFQTDDYILKKIQKNTYGIVDGIIKIEKDENNENVLAVNQFQDGRAIVFPEDLEVAKTTKIIGFDPISKSLMRLEYDVEEKEIVWNEYDGALEPIFFENTLTFDTILASNKQEMKYKCIVLVDDDVVMVEPNIVFTNIDEVYNNGAIMKALASLSIGFDDDSNGNYYLYDTVGSIVDKTMSSKIRTLEPLLDGSSITTDTIYNITWNVPNKNSMIRIENDKTLQDYQKKSSFENWFDQFFKDEEEIIENGEDTNSIEKYQLTSKVGYAFKLPVNPAEEAKSLSDKYHIIKTSDAMSYNESTKKITIYAVENNENKTIEIEDLDLYTTDNIIVTAPTLNYTIASRYSPSYNTHNIISCSVVNTSDSSLKYDKIVELSFGQQGTSGTQYTLELDFEGHQQGLLWEENKSITVIAQLYNGENLLQDFSSATINWSFEHNVSETEKKCTFMLSKTASGDSCLLTPDMTSATSTNEDLYNYNILKCSFQWEGYNLTAYLPIPIIKYRKATNKGVDLDLQNTYLKGPNKIIYSTDGTPNWFNSPYELKTNVPFADAINCSIYGKFKNSNIIETFENDNYLTIDGTSSLKPSVIYDKNRMYGIKCSVEDSAEEGSGASLTWYQPLLLLQNEYFSSTINAWNGQQVEIDENKILTPLLIVGEKDSSNRFSGLSLGRYTDDGSPDGATGLYGFKEGALTYAFKDDGTGFIGSSAGRIKFDGNACQILSGASLNTDLFKNDKPDLLIDLNLDNDTHSNSEYGFITLGNEKYGLLKLGYLNGSDFYPFYYLNSSYKTYLNSNTGELVTTSLNAERRVDLNPGGKLIFNYENSSTSGKYNLRVSANGRMGCYHI